MAVEDIERFRQLLSENKKWPRLYMFKFIVPNIDGKVNKVVKLMPKNGEVSFKHTKNLRHVSVTCKVSMPSAQSIIDVTMQVASIQGVISL